MGPGRSVVLISGCWATVELIAALPDAYRRRRCLGGVSHAGHTWVSHRCVLSACEVRRSAAAGVVAASSTHQPRHRQRSGVRCTVTDAVSDAVSTPVLLYLGDRTPATV